METDAPPYANERESASIVGLFLWAQNSAPPFAHGSIATLVIVVLSAFTVTRDPCPVICAMSVSVYGSIEVTAAVADPDVGLVQVQERPALSRRFERKRSPTSGANRNS